MVRDASRVTIDRDESTIMLSLPFYYDIYIETTLCTCMPMSPVHLCARLCARARFCVPTEIYARARARTYAHGHVHREECMYGLCMPAWRALRQIPRTCIPGKLGKKINKKKSQDRSCPFQRWFTRWSFLLDGWPRRVSTPIVRSQIHTHRTCARARVCVQKPRTRVSVHAYEQLNIHVQPRVYISVM